MISPANIMSQVNSLKNLVGNEEGTHIWQFSRVGGVNRVNLETGMDLVLLDQLDQKLWTALSCPVHGLEIDAKTLELIDTDNDDRIRVPEILEAVKWITSVIKNPDDLLKDNLNLSLSAINDNTTLGKSLLASAKQILNNLGKPESTEITVEDTLDTTKIFATTKFNGDGIITEDTPDDIAEKKLVVDIISCMGSAIDRSGNPGITMEHLNDFYTNCNDYSEWYKLAENNQEKILPIGENTEAAYNAFQSVKSKIEDYFLRCKLAEFDPQSAAVLNLLTARFEAISVKDLTTCMDEIASFPIAKIESGQLLSLKNGINPAWAKMVENFRKLVVQPVYADKEKLSEKEWLVLSDMFQGFSTWKSEKKGVGVEKLGIAAIREIILQNKLRDIGSLIIKDKALECEALNIFLVEKMVRYNRDIYTLLKNFVTFHDFYSPHAESIFQVGSLYIDQRSCDLCIKVSDMAKHGTMAGSSGICLVYCDCVSKSKNEKMTIVAALTDGDIDNISVGRNAIFYDRKGNDWDATIIKIIDNPISIRQAFWSPYRKVSKFISSQIEKVASAKDKDVHATATASVEKTSTHVEKGITKSIQSAPAASSPAVPAAVAAAPAAAAPPFDIGKFVGIFAAISLALGAIGSIIASVLTGFLSLTWWKMPLAFIGIILTISGPSMIMAWLKLRKRNLAPILDANGWAINARATINIVFGNTLTHLASLPKNSKMNLLDPFSKKKNPLIPIIIISVAVLGIAAYLLWHYGFLRKWGIL